MGEKKSLISYSLRDKRVMLSVGSHGVNWIGSSGMPILTDEP
jgi:hypothetical protein